ncbi:Zinc finger protein [Plakobranchus ocellatus]|uniref:Zinc finger protein n=1 Tax=Plakobranchus ocellatus TaxID=259542 RepID=A0AAV3Y328_9GAST|nr:Zinc finger protein [Plakobranchus ocellatus]
MYGRQVRGPTDIIADICEGRNNHAEEYVFVHRYVQDLEDKVKESGYIASRNAAQELKRYRDMRNKTAVIREYKRGDKVLILLPKDGNNLYMTYQGPYSIHSVGKNNNYLCKTGDSLRLYHANLLRKYEDRQDFTLCGNLAFVEDVGDESEESPITFVQSLRKETLQNVKVNQDAPVTFRDQAKAVLREFDDVLSDLPGHTDIIRHEIKLTDPTPFGISQYPIPFHARVCNKTRNTTDAGYSPNFSEGYAQGCRISSIRVVAPYFDDILIHSTSWEDHLLDLEATLQALRQHNSTGKPSKIFVGYTSIEFLGHIVEEGVVRPDEAKTEKILNI